MQGYEVTQSSTAYPLVFLLISSTDHISPLTGASPTVVISKGGSAFAAPAGAVSEIGDGWYKVAGNATDTATLGPLILHATATGADPTDALFPVVAVNPQSATNYGLTNLDAAVSSRSTYAGGAVASVTGNVGGNVIGSVGSVTGAVGSVTAVVAANVTQWLGSAPATPSVAGVPIVDVHYHEGQADSATAQAGSSTTITLAAGEPTTISYAGQYVAIVAGTGERQARYVQSSTVTGGNVVLTVEPPWDVAPDATSVYQLGGYGLVTLSLTETLATPRALDAIADGSITLNDALWCAVAAAAGKESITGTTYVVQTPATGTTIRTFTLDSGTTPTSRT